MKKSKKLKLITTLSSLGIVGAAVPVVATSCSKSSEDEDVSLLDDIKWNGASIPGTMTLIADSEPLELNPSAFEATYKGMLVDIESLSIKTNDEYETYVKKSQIGDTWYLTPVAETPKNTSIKVTIAVYDDNGHCGLTNTWITVASSELTNIKYNGSSILPTQYISVWANSETVFKKNLFTADYSGTPTTIRNVYIGTVESEAAKYVSFTKDAAGNITMHANAITPTYVELYFILEDTNGYRGLATTFLLIKSTAFTDVKYDGATIPESYKLIKNESYTWNGVFTATNPTGQTGCTPKDIEIWPSDETKQYVEVAKNQQGYYTCKALEPSNGYITLYFKLTFDFNGQDAYAYATSKVIVGSNQLTNIKYENKSLGISTNSLNEGEMMSYDKENFTAQYTDRNGDTQDVTTDQILGVRVISNDTEQQYVTIKNSADPEEEWFASSAITARQGMNAEGYVELYVQISARVPGVSTILVGEVTVKLHIDYTWNTVGYKLSEDGKYVIAVQESLSGKEREYVEHEIVAGKDIIPTDTTQAAAENAWRQLADGGTLILSPRTDAAQPYSLLNLDDKLPKDVAIIGLMDGNGHSPKLEAGSIWVDADAQNESDINISFAGIDFVNRSDTTTGDTVTIGNSKIEMASLNFNSCGFYNTNVYIHKNVTVDEFIVNQCTFESDQTTRDAQYATAGETSENISKWSSLMCSGDVENANITNNYFFGALFNAVQYTYYPASSFRMTGNYFSNIENRIALIIGDANSKTFDIRDNQIAQSCNANTRTEKGKWIPHQNQLIRVGCLSSATEETCIQPRQWIKFKAIERDNTYGINQEEISWQYVAYEEGKAGDVGFRSWKPGTQPKVD